MAMALIGTPGSGLALDGNAGVISLIMEVPANGETIQPGHSAVVVRERVVAVDVTSLTGGSAPQLLELQFFPDIQYTARLLWIESVSERDLAWIGRLADQPNSRITLVTDGHRVSATIRVQGQRYDLRPLENGLHLVQQIDNDALPAGEILPGNTVHGISAAVDGASVRSELMGEEELQVLALGQ